MSQGRVRNSIAWEGNRDARLSVRLAPRIGFSCAMATAAVCHPHYVSVLVRSAPSNLAPSLRRSCSH